ncbi:NAD(P)-binding domain-containing protein [Salinicoccus roseus]|uniref:NAD(P)-binding domain-containing protein n=1 Tax=Salinicoccus roseus TaxID=45670 RepID=UPI000F4E2315|nr:NAD(P)-binding domain-containing protein [Salinicoccus roseus]RPE52926.1 3-hydroxyisobutyrate dehydrogenase-like beta-hydroxyacid dehydrogenase [Salinicoccus roseus]GGA72212.1 2-hydroxy-3-oxopropionate reductase [Salinicoccus roseus]
MNIGFIGLGIMGAPMVKNLLGHRHTVFVNDVNKEAEARVVEQGATSVGSLQEMAERADAIITMLPNGAIVKEVLFKSEDALYPHLKEGQMVIDMSSLAPTDSIEINGILEAKHVIFADAPVSGGEPLAITGELSVMMGCSADHFNSLKAVVEPMSKSVIRVGDVGAGSTVKLANQIIVNTNIAALAEAVVLAKNFDIDLEAMFEAIRNGLAGSNVMEAKFPKMIDEDYKAGGTININFKDLHNVTSTSDQEQITLPLTNMVKEMYKSEIINGNGMNDHSGIIKYIERINGR